MAGLSTTELKLAEGVPFGSYEYISEHLSNVYVKLLAVIATDSLAARDFLKKLDSLDEKSRDIVFRDPLTRRTIEDGVCRIVRGTDTIEPSILDELLSAAAENALTVKRTVLNESARCVLCSRTLGRRYIWVDDQSNTLPERRFKEEVLKRLPGLDIRIPTRDQIDTLIAGSCLAERIAPSLARSAMSHNFMVVIGEFENAEQQFNSLTTPGLPGVIFLSPKVLSTSLEAAEALFHEALHLKFLDIDYIHPLFAPGFRAESSPRVTPVWHSNKPENGNWPIDRVLTSMHVYLALAVFHGKASDGNEAGVSAPEEHAARASQCKTRANWLFDSAQNYLELLSAAGREFVASVGTMLTELDTSRLPTAHH
jgi:hypothetical protein